MIHETTFLYVSGKLHDALQLMNRAALATKQNQNLAFLTAPPPPPPPPPVPPRRETPQEVCLFSSNILYRILSFTVNHST